jgi:hypothetical protein
MDTNVALLETGPGVTADGRARWLLAVMVLVAALLGTLLSVLPAQPASADSVGCTLAPGGPGASVCLGLYGSGNFLKSTRVSYGAGANPQNVCRTQAKWTGPLGTIYSSYRSGCVFQTAWFDHTVNRNAPGKWCGTMRSNLSDNKYPSPACNRVG